MRIFVLALVLFRAAFGCGPQNITAKQAAIPDAATLIKQVEEHQRKLDQTRENYTYREIVVIHQLDKTGKLKKTESEEDEVFFVN